MSWIELWLWPGIVGVLVLALVYFSKATLRRKRDDAFDEAAAATSLCRATLIPSVCFVGIAFCGPLLFVLSSGVIIRLSWDLLLKGVRHNDS